MPYEVGLEAVEELRRSCPRADDGRSSRCAGSLMFEAVTCAIPGAKTPQQARDNAAAADLPPLAPSTMAAVRAVYDEKIRPLVHASW